MKAFKSVREHNLPKFTKNFPKIQILINTLCIRKFQFFPASVGFLFGTSNRTKHNAQRF